MFKFIFKLIRLSFIAALGAAAAAKFMLKSNATPTTQEVDMVAIFGGEDLASDADPFYGGKILTMFGGTKLDLRNAKPAPTGVFLDLVVVFGGVMLIVPDGWRVKFDGKVIGGGFDDVTSTDASPDTPTVHIGGIIAMGGVKVLNMSGEEMAAE